MTKQDFLLSDERHHRVARHLAFWATWSVVYLLCVHYPVHSFSGWAFDAAVNPGPFAQIQKIGLASFVLKTLLFNALMAVVVPQIFFVYAFVFWLLPRFYYTKRNTLLAAGVTVSILLIYFILAVCLKWMVPLGGYVFGVTKTLVFDNPFVSCIQSATGDAITSLPIVLGFALLIKQIKRWWLKQKQTAQLGQEKTKAELQLLKAQVHPHFLFNTLNNIYYFALNGSPKAPEMIEKLSGLLQYILQECNRPLVPLCKELAMIQDYTALEKIRYGEGMKMDVTIEGECDGKYISPLLLIPFVENSFKHGASKMITQPWVKMRIAVNGKRLLFTISNSRPQATAPSMQKGNIGLKNVQKRLQLLYPTAHKLAFVSEPECFAVHLHLTLADAGVQENLSEEINQNPGYAVA